MKTFDSGEAGHGRPTPLDEWTRQKIGGAPVSKWQLRKLQETIALARENSPFYRERLPLELPETLSDIRKLPLMDAGDIVRDEMRLLCVSPTEITRVVSLRTSGTTSAPKRLYFTEDDLNLTIDFFAGGLPTVVAPKGVMAIMMPCGTPNGVGDLIRRGLARMPATGIPHGPLTCFESASRMLVRSGATSLVGPPVQVMALSRYLTLTGTKTALSKVLLSAEYVPNVLVNELRAKGIEVYKHFGLTETGYGCAIDCDSHVGQHIREADLLIEILDPDTCEPLPDGAWGEVVITTLTRRGLPLIRYRTGDLSRVISDVCPCGSNLRRLGDVLGRRADKVFLAGGTLTMPELDETLLALPQIMDYALEITPETLHLRLTTFADMGPLTDDMVRESLRPIVGLGGVKLEIAIEPGRAYRPLHQGKRTFVRRQSTWSTAAGAA